MIRKAVAVLLLAAGFGSFASVVMSSVERGQVESSWMAVGADYRIEATEPYFHDLRERWSSALRAAHLAIPRPPYTSS